MTLPTQEYLRKMLSYDSQTGEFRWIAEPRVVGRVIGNIAGTLRPSGYIFISIQGRQIGAHRCAWIYAYGALPCGQIDHINRDRQDNRLCNLRAATIAQNIANTCIRSNNTSGFKGVHFSIRKRKWEAYIKIEKKRKHLGWFDSAESAANAYDAAAETVFGEYALTNAHLAMVTS